MWNKTITIYNRYEDDETGLISWFRHILTDCFVKTTNNRVNVSSVSLNSDNSIIRIPVQKDYLSPFEWNDISYKEKQQHLTINKGDLIFFGAVYEEIYEHSHGERSNDLIEKYKLLGSITVDSVNINDFGPLAHYFIKGK